MPAALTHTTAATLWRAAVISASRNFRARPPLPTQSAATRVSPSAALTWMLPRKRMTYRKPRLSRNSNSLTSPKPRSARIVTATPSGSQRLQAGQAQVLEIVALVLQFVLVDGQPEERRGPAVAGDEMQRERGLIVGVEVGPVHRHHNLAPLAHDLANPRTEQLPGDHARVAQQPIDLFDRGLGEQSTRLRERLADQGNRERKPRSSPRAFHWPKTARAWRANRR